ncbi:MAG TPA: protein adenylyltransferase SelO family protein, partial [Burkholderiales bacterium]|nr:protein adenylyltransferase SelO family protein [Burkholderiales bacterium]
LGLPSRLTYARWFEEICRRTAIMLAEWTRVGFVHGVMNTDNMSILGLTIDYGPYGWLEGYDLHWTPNTTDVDGRYCYGNQPSIALWNLARLGDALTPLIDDRCALEQALSVFGETYEQASSRMLADKLGLVSLDQPGDALLVDELFALMQQVETDMTLFFRLLATLPVEGAAEIRDDDNLVEPMRRAFYSEEAFAPAQRSRLASWLRRYIARLTQDAEPASDRCKRMNRVNPKYVLRNYLAQQAIDALESGDVSVMARLMTVLQDPYAEQPEHDELAERRPEWARHRPGCSALSCSS